MNAGIPIPPMPWTFRLTPHAPPGVVDGNFWWAICDAGGEPLAWVAPKGSITIPQRFVGHTAALGASAWPLLGRMDGLLFRVAKRLQETGSVELADELVAAMQEYHRCRERREKCGDGK